MCTDTSTLARWSSIVALLIAFTAIPARAQLGVAAGLNFESSDDITNAAQADGVSEAAFDNSTGYHIGVVYDLGAGPVSLRPGLFYRKVGTYEFAGQTGGTTSYDVSVIEIPVDIRYTLLPTPVVSPYLMGGPMASFPRGEDEFDDVTNDLSLSANIGAGVEISAPGLPVTIVPELRYEFGITKYVSDEEISIGDSVTFEPEDEPRFSAFSVRLHLIF